MNTIHFPSPMTPGLLDYLKSAESGAAFVRKTVLVRDVIGLRWMILGSVVRPHVGPAVAPHQYRYKDVILDVDLTTPDDVFRFFNSARQGSVTIAGEEVLVRQAPPPGSDVTAVSVQNHWMEQAGSVYSVHWHDQVNAPQYQRLVGLEAPYFPDVFEATRYWLGLREYHGSSDSSKGCMLFLIPETRGFFVGGAWSGESTLDVQVDGELARAGDLSVLGAWWSNKAIHQVHAPVLDGFSRCTVGAEADRLELVLVNQRGDILDFHTESRGTTLGGGRTFLTNRAAAELPNQVLRMIEEGEGLHVEFKEFLDLPKVKAPFGEKDKFLQVLKTVSAFANTDGGTILFGVTDDGDIVGAAQGVSQWVGGAADAASFETYMGALRTKVREGVYPGVELRTSRVDCGGKWVILLDIQRSAAPVSVTQEQRLYTRRTGSNRKMEPADWVPPSPPFERI